MFEEIFESTEGLAREWKVMTSAVPDLEMDQPLYDYQPASGSFEKLSAPLLTNELAAELFGQNITLAKVPVHEPGNVMHKFFKSGMTALCCVCNTQFPSKAEMDVHFASHEVA